MTWKRSWNRLVDGYDNEAETRNRLLEIEMKTFKNVKSKVVEETGPWTGTPIQNQLADLKISQDVANSFRAYEKGMKYKGSFFLFKAI